MEVGIVLVHHINLGTQVSVSTMKLLQRLEESVAILLVTATVLCHGLLRENVAFIIIK